MLQGSCESEEKDVISIWPMTQRAGPPQRAPAGTAVVWECVWVSVCPGSVGAAGFLQTLRVQCGWFLQPAASLGEPPCPQLLLGPLGKGSGRGGTPELDNTRRGSRTFSAFRALFWHQRTHPFSRHTET